MAAELDVTVSWVGFLNQSELGKAYASANCLALPSDWGESWGLVVNEALAAGLPCVVSDRVGCSPDLIEEGATGLAYPGGDFRALAAAIQSLRTAPEARMATPESCRQRVRAFSFAAATEGLVAACRSVAPRASGFSL